MHGRNPVRTTTFFRTPNERPCAKPILREQTSTSRLHRQTSALASPTIRRSPRATQTWVPQDVVAPVMCDDSDSDDEDYHDEGGCADGQNDYGDDSNNKTVMLHSCDGRCLDGLVLSHAALAFRSVPRSSSSRHRVFRRNFLRAGVCWHASSMLPHPARSAFGGEDPQGLSHKDSNNLVGTFA